MRPTSGMYHSRTADLIVGRVPVSLQNAFELSQKALRSIASTAQAEVEHHRSSRATVLPQIRLVVLSPALACLHIDRGFIRLNVTSANQLSPHRGDQGTSNSPTLRTQPSSVARLISKPMSLSRITLCRCSGVWLQYLLTTVSMTMRSLAMHFSMIRGGRGAETTPSSSHDRQARFSRFMTSTKYLAGSTSNWELSSYPITTVSFPQRLHTR